MHTEEIYTVRIESGCEKPISNVIAVLLPELAMLQVTGDDADEEE